MFHTRVFQTKTTMPQKGKISEVSDPAPDALTTAEEKQGNLISQNNREKVLISSPVSQSLSTPIEFEASLIDQRPRRSSLLSSSPRKSKVTSPQTSPKKITFAPSTDQTVKVANTALKNPIESSELTSVTHPANMLSHANATTLKGRKSNYPTSIPYQRESPLSSMSTDQEDNYPIKPPSVLRNNRAYSGNANARPNPLNIQTRLISAHSRSTVRASNFNDAGGNPHPYVSQDRMEPRMLPSPTRALPTTSFPSSGLGKRGTIQARTCPRSILFRKWQTQYWIHEYPVTIHLFDTEEDRDSWSRWYSKNHPPTSPPSIDLEETKPPAATTTSPTSVVDFAQELDHNKLIAYSIHFDTQGHLQKRMDKVERKRNKILGLEVDNRKRVSDEEKEYKDLKTNTNLVKKYIMEDVRSKYYSKGGSLMCVFEIFQCGDVLLVCACVLVSHFSFLKIGMPAKLAIWEMEDESSPVHLEVRNQVN